MDKVLTVKWPTGYADVDEVLLGFLERARRILGANFVGMYLYGSLAAGDFDPGRSDIDFVVVTEREVSDEEVEKLRDMHDRFLASESPWAAEIDGSYIAREAMRRYDPQRARHPHIERGVGKLRMEWFRPDWVIQRHVLREHGVALAGPAPETLIEPVGPDEIRRALRALAVEAWGPAADDPETVAHRGAQVYAALTMCRMLHTLETGEVVSKQTAGRWALTALDERWRPLIERALAWKKTDPRENVAGDAQATVELIRLTARRWRADGDGQARD